MRMGILVKHGVLRRCCVDIDILEILVLGR